MHFTWGLGLKKNILRNVIVSVFHHLPCGRWWNTLTITFRIILFFSPRPHAKCMRVVYPYIPGGDHYVNPAWYSSIPIIIRELFTTSHLLCNLSWQRVRMSYHIFNNLAELLNRYLAAKIGWRIFSKDLMYIGCNCYIPSKVSRKKSKKVNAGISV